MTEAKKAVEEAPTVIAEAASKDDAKKMKEVLEAAGAKVELVIMLQKSVSDRVI